jgi:hypothetical protein
MACMDGAMACTVTDALAVAVWVAWFPYWMSLHYAAKSPARSDQGDCC